MNIVEFGEMVKAHTWENKDIFFTSNALGGEVGEVQNVLKKENAYQDFPRYREMCDRQIAAGTRPTHHDHFIDEAGDVLFYFMQLINKKGVTMDEVIEGQRKKIQDLSDSYGHAYKK